MDIAAAVAPGCDIKITGIRPGEKLHESMISTSDAPNTREYADHFRICPSIQAWSDEPTNPNDYKSVPADFEYTSDKNPTWMSSEQLKSLLTRYKHSGPELLHLDERTINVSDIMKTGFAELT